MPKSTRSAGTIGPAKVRKFGLLIAALFATIAVAAAIVIVFALSFRQVTQIARTRLESRADESMFTSERRYESAVTMLRSLRGLFYANDAVTADDFERFIVTSGFPQLFPEFNVLVYVTYVPGAEKEAFLASARSSVEAGGTGDPGFTIKPEGTRDAYMPAMLMFPLSLTKANLGYDLFWDPVQRANIERARDVGDVSVSEDIVSHVSGKTGASIAVPMYRTLDVPATLEERRTAFAGAVGFSFGYIDFPMGALRPEELNSSGINVSMGRPGEGSIAFFRAPSPKVFLGPVYGNLVITRRLALNQADEVDVTFDAQSAALLTTVERLAPFGITLTFILVVIIAGLSLLLLRRAHALSNLQQRYTLVSTISHQLRTPITKMRWSTEALGDAAPGDREELLRTIKQDTLTLNSIVGDLLLFLEWTEMGKLKGNEPLVELSSIVEGSVAQLADRGDTDRVTIALGKAGKFRVRAEEKKLSAALAFIVDNALTYSPTGSPIDIGATAEAGSVTVSISDRGYGIPKAEQQQIWSDFFRASNASLGKNAGSGVGLPLAKTIVEAHGGSISFTSEEKKGTTFSVRLPISNG